MGFESLSVFPGAGFQRMLDLWLLDDGGTPEWDRQVTEEREVGWGRGVGLGPAQS